MYEETRPGEVSTHRAYWKQEKLEKIASELLNKFKWMAKEEQIRNGKKLLGTRS